MLRGECIAMITSVRLLPSLWITGLLAKGTKELNDVVARNIFLPALTRIWIILFPRKPGSCFAIGVRIFRLLRIIIIIGQEFLIFTIRERLIHSGPKGAYMIDPIFRV